jgi:hypothetical protein
MTTNLPVFQAVKQTATTYSKVHSDDFKEAVGNPVFFETVILGCYNVGVYPCHFTEACSAYGGRIPGPCRFFRAVPYGTAE